MNCASWGTLRKKICQQSSQQSKSLDSSGTPAPSPTSSNSCTVFLQLTGVCMVVWECDWLMKLLHHDVSVVQLLCCCRVGIDKVSGIDDVFESVIVCSLNSTWSLTIVPFGIVLPVYSHCLIFIMTYNLSFFFLIQSRQERKARVIGVC